MVVELEVCKSPAGGHDCAGAVLVTVRRSQKITPQSCGREFGDEEQPPDGFF